MKILSLEQGSKDWLSYRSKHIMATDAAIILSLSVWKDSHQLWQEKMGFIEPEPANESMKRGQLLEPIAREKLCERLGINFDPMVIESIEYPWMGASLDGLSQKYESRIICEIKCMKLQKHLQFSKENVDPCHFAQIQHQLACCECEFAYYASYHPDAPDPLTILTIYRNDEYIEEMIEKEKEFFFETMCNMQPTRDSWTFKQRAK